MSYILEALRRVERQRRTRAIPDLATVHGPSAAQRVRSWTPVVLGALILNAGLLALLLWYRPWAPSVPPPAIEAKAPAAEVTMAPPAPSAAPAPAPAPATGAPAPPAAAPAPAPVASASPPGVSPSPPVGGAAPSSGGPSAPGQGATASAPAPAPALESRSGGPDLPAHLGPAARSAEPAQPREEPTSRKAQGAEAERPPAAPPEPRLSPAPRETARATPPAAPPAPRGAVKATAPSDLPPAFREAVAQLRLEALVLADSPRDRKVFINGRRYVEGEKLEDGILVEKIVEEGVILSYLGHRHVLRHFR